MKNLLVSFALWLALSLSASGQTINSPGELLFRERPVVAWAGNSICYATIGANTATGTYNTGRGPAYWARFLTGQRIYSPQSLNFCVAGDTSTALLNRINTVLASGASTYVLEIGTNDIASIPFATTISNITSIVDRMLATGARVYLQTILPRGLATQSSRDQLWRTNNWIRSFAQQRDRLYLFDPAVDFVDPTSATMTPRANYTYDDLHPKTLGAYYAYRSLATLINQQIPPRAPSMVSATDVFAATDNPNGNLVTNGILAGTGGTNGAGGGTITGDISASWTLAHSANGGTITSLTTTASKVTLADGRPAQRLQISGTYTGAGTATINQGTAVIFRQDLGSLNATNYPVGSRIAFGADLSVAAGSSSIAGIECQLTTTIGGTTYTIGDGSAYSGDLIPPDAYSGSCLTEAFEIPSGSITLMRVGIRTYLLNGANTVVGDITIAGPKLARQ